MNFRDKKHAKLMNDFIEYIKLLEKGGNAKFIGNECPYNHYGSKGCIDVIYVDWEGIYNIVELKATIENLGETIRQVKNAKEFFLKSKPEILNIGKAFSENSEKKRKVPFYKKFVYPLILPLTEGFIEFVDENKNNFSNIEVLFFGLSDSNDPDKFIRLPFYAFRGGTLKRSSQGYVDEHDRVVCRYYKF